jgi:hypothetical protein
MSQYRTDLDDEHTDLVIQETDGPGMTVTLATIAIVVIVVIAIVVLANIGGGSTEAPDQPGAIPSVNVEAPSVPVAAPSAEGG